MFDASFNWVAGANGTENTEHIEYPLPSGHGGGDYYVRVYFSDVGNSYNLLWDAASGGDPIYGSLEVTIYPQSAADAGAQWRVSEGAWHDSGETVSDLNPDDFVHIVEFKTISGWTTPGPQLAQIYSGQTATLGGTYVISDSNPTDSHFGTVKGNATSPLWAVHLQSATLGGVNLQPGDEIAIYDGVTLVGPFKLEEVLTEAGQNTNVLKAWSELTDESGYVAGNPYTFKCWDESEQSEFIAQNPILSNPYGEAYTGNVFPDEQNPRSFVKLSFSDSLGQTLELSEGYQIVSLYVRPDDPDMENVLDDIMINLDFVINSEGDSLRKIGNEWINNIGDWNPGEGYLIRMNRRDTLVVEGTPADSGTRISLERGYQMVPYLPADPLSPGPREVLSGFGSIANNLDFVIDSYGNMFRKIGQSWADNIGSLNPGEGYLVKMNASDELRYVQSGQRKRSARSAGRTRFGSSCHFGKVKGDPTAALWRIYLSQAELDGAELEPGDEIAIFDGETLAGSLTLSETPGEENQYKSVLKVWSVAGDDAGYGPGNPYTFRCWDASEGVEINGGEVVFDDFQSEAYAGDVFPDRQNPYSIATLIFSSEASEAY